MRRSAAAYSRRFSTTPSLPPLPDFTDGSTHSLSHSLDTRTHDIFIHVRAHTQVSSPTTKHSSLARSSSSDPVHMRRSPTRTRARANTHARARAHTHTHTFTRSRGHTHTHSHTYADKDIKTRHLAEGMLCSAAAYSRHDGPSSTPSSLPSLPDGIIDGYIRSLAHSLTLNARPPAHTHAHTAHAHAFERPSARAHTHTRGRSTG